MVTTPEPSGKVRTGHGPGATAGLGWHRANRGRRTRSGARGRAPAVDVAAGTGSRGDPGRRAWAVVSGVDALSQSLSADQANTVDLVVLLARPAVVVFAVVWGFTRRTGRGSVRSWAGVLAAVGLVNGALWGAGSASRGGDGNLVVAAVSCSGGSAGSRRARGAGWPGTGARAPAEGSPSGSFPGRRCWCAPAPLATAEARAAAVALGPRRRTCPWSLFHVYRRGTDRQVPEQGAEWTAAPAQWTKAEED